MTPDSRDALTGSLSQAESPAIRNAVDPTSGKPLRILVITQYFWPENFQINHLVRGLQERGHRVTVLTGKPNYPAGKIYDGYAMLDSSREDWQGVTVIRVPLIPRGSSRPFRLALNYLSFTFIASILGPFKLREVYDCIFVYAPSPVIVGLPGLVIRGRKNVPVLYWAQDLWPDSVRIAGGVRSPVLIGLLHRVVAAIERGCDRVLIQSQAFRSHMERNGVEPRRIVYFPQSADTHFRPVPPAAEAPAPFSLPGFRIVFAGNIAEAQDFETVVSAADRLRDYEIHWIIVGDGRRRAWLADEVKRRGLQHRMHLPGRFPEQDMPGFFAHADALLVTLRKEPIFAMTIPTKVQAYLASGKPIVAALDGEGARIITQAGAGIAAPSGDPEALAQAVLALYGMSPHERAAIGARALDYSRSHFDRATLIDILVAEMREAITEMQTARPAQG